MKAVARRTLDQRLDLKERDGSVSLGTIVMGGLSCYNVSNIAQGIMEQQREGNRVRLKSIFFQGYAGIQDEPAFVRCALVWANFESDVAIADPTLGVIWTTDASDGTWGARYLSQSTNWVIIWERRYQLMSSMNYMSPIKIYKKLDHIIKYYGALGSDASRGKMWLVATSDSVNAPHPAIGGQIRVRFMDD